MGTITSVSIQQTIAITAMIKVRYIMLELDNFLIVLTQVKI